MSKTVGLDEDARKLFDGKNFAFVATVNRDGSPQVTPVWVDTDGKYILVNTAIGRVKQRKRAFHARSIDETASRYYDSES